MGKITSKLQVTVPKAVAERCGLAPGDEIEWQVAGDTIRIVKSSPERAGEDTIERRLALFDAATKRQRDRQQGKPQPSSSSVVGRGWTREDLYVRDSAD